MSGLAQCAAHTRGPAENLPGLAQCEAHTAYAAAEALEYLVDAFGVRRSLGSKPGRIVFVPRACETAAARP